MKTDGVNYFVSVPKNVRDALMVESIASSLWCEAVEKWASSCKKTHDEMENALSASNNAKTRKRVLADMCKLGPVPYLYRALEADLLWRGEWRLIRERAEARMRSLESFVGNPSCWDGSPDKDRYVEECKEKLTLITEFARKRLDLF